MTKPLTIDWDGPTAILTFDRPPVNAVDLATAEAFDIELAKLEANPPAGGVVLAGKQAFCSGLDVKMLPSYTDAERRDMILAINRFVRRLYGLPTATVAAVGGHAIGAGGVLMLACDARVVARGDYRIGLTEVTAGVPFPACPMEVVKAELDPQLRRDLVLTGRVFGPDEAHETGIADTIVTPAHLMEEAIARAHAMAPARGYAPVKAQLKAAALAAMAHIVSMEDDPMLDAWLA